MKCPRCQHENPAAQKFCGDCGMPLQGLDGSVQTQSVSYPGVQQSLNEALARETATAEILRVIGSSPNDAQQVFETIARSGVSVCAALGCAVFVVDGNVLRVAATHGVRPERVERLRREYPIPLDAEIDTAQIIRERRIFHLADIPHNPNATATDIEYARLAGYRTRLMVPMVRGDRALGLIAVTREAPTPFSGQQVELLKTFAEQAVIAIENVRLFTELEARNRQVTEALDRETATGDILRAISHAQTDAQPVFGAIADSAMRLLAASAATVVRYDGQMVSLVAARGGLPGSADVAKERFQPPHRPRPGPEQALLSKTVHHVVDVHTDTSCGSEFRRHAAERGIRSFVAVPMLRGGDAVGMIVVSRAQPRGFSAAEIALLQTFADQAAIAIENVRLFNETKEALEQQTATSEILRVIAASPNDLTPVFDTILRNASQLCAGFYSLLFLCDGEKLDLAATHNVPAEGLEALRRRYPISITSDEAGLTARAVRERRLQQVADIQSASSIPAAARRVSEAVGQRAGVVVPLLREGQPVGALTVSRREAGAFSMRELVLLQTFADQAVIAIENVRLFTELRDNNRALTQAHAHVTEALEQQTATAEILRVISRSPSDLQPVFDTIVRNAVRLCGAGFGGLHRVENGRITLDAQEGLSADELMIIQRDIFPLPLSRESATGRAMLDRAIVHIRDIREDPDFRTPHLKAMQGFRTILGIPMIRDGVSIGALALWRREVRPFSDSETALVQTFADQAVIAIENVRLFKELEARTAALTRSVDQLTALGEVGRAVSSTLDLGTVLTTIVSRAVELSGLDGGLVSEYDEIAEEFVQRATAEIGEVLPQALREVRYRKGEGAIGRTAITREPVQIADITVPGVYESRVRQSLIESGVRAVLAVPMIHQNRLIGCLGVTRKRPGRFRTETIELLRTFATQSALAIQNARLYQEIADKSRQLEAASQHKSEFLANMSHELRTPLNAVIGFSEVLRDRMFGDLNEKQEEYLNDIHVSGQHLLSLINDILDLSKIEAGRMELELTDFHLPAALDNALTLVRERAGRRGIALHATIDEGIEYLRADERKMKQVLLNLLSNAIKFTPEGGQIEVRATLGVRVVEVSVSDTGVGIAPEDQEAIFEEFRQVGTAAKKVEGTGLGLALSRKFVELHGGRIWVESQVGQGSTFTFTIPMRSAE